MVDLLTYLPNIYSFLHEIWFNMAFYVHLQKCRQGLISQIPPPGGPESSVQVKVGRGAEMTCLCFFFLPSYYTWSSIILGATQTFYHHREESCMLRTVWALNGRSQSPSTPLFCPTSFTSLLPYFVTSEVKPSSLVAAADWAIAGTYHFRQVLVEGRLALPC